MLKGLQEKYFQETSKQVDFKLADHFCDGNELKESWENTPIPEQVMTFFAALFGIRRSRMVKTEMLQMENDDSDNDDDNVEGDGTCSLDDVVEVDWAV